MKKNYDKNITENGDKKGKEDDCDSDIISNYIGHYGKWQFYWTFVLCLFQLPSTFQIFAFVFQSTDRRFWCARPPHLQSINPTTWYNLTQTSDGCNILNLDYWSMSAENFSSNFLDNINTNVEYVECQLFEFDDSVIGRTVVEEWNLICGDMKFLSFVEMCFLAGAACGSITSGWISDRHGRRHTLMIAAIIQVVTGTIIAFVNSVKTFMILRFIIGFASMSIVVVSFVLVVELVSGKWRTIIGILNILPVAIAYIITAGIAYFAYDWRTIQLSVTLPCFCLLLIWYNLPESPRWLLEKGRIDELKIVIENAAETNKIELPLNYEKTLIPPAMSDSNLSFCDLFKNGYAKTTLLMIVLWFCLILLYFGLTLHLNNLGGNIYYNTAIAGLVEAISICLSILVVLKLGLRINIFIYMLIAGIACLMCYFVSEGTIWKITLAMIGKCTIGACNAIIPTYTAFQYPCVMRNLAVGVGNFAAGAALMIVPYLWLLEHVESHLPMTIMGIFGIIGAISICFMNEKSIDENLNKFDEESYDVPDKLKCQGIGNLAFVRSET